MKVPLSMRKCIYKARAEEIGEKTGGRKRQRKKEDEMFGQRKIKEQREQETKKMRIETREERKMKEQIDGAADEKAAVRSLSRKGKIKECC